MLKILKKIPSKISLFETVLITANDELVEYFLNGQISYLEIQQNLFKIINFKEFKKYFYKKPQNIDQITKVIKEARLKTRNLCV